CTISAWMRSASAGSSVTCWSVAANTMALELTQLSIGLVACSTTSARTTPTAPTVRAISSAVGAFMVASLSSDDAAAAVALPIAVAQRPLVQLAGGQARQRVGEVDRART